MLALSAPEFAFPGSSILVLCAPEFAPVLVLSAPELAFPGSRILILRAPEFADS